MPSLCVTDKSSQANSKQRKFVIIKNGVEGKENLWKVRET